jgi:hypothetical protein
VSRSYDAAGAHRGRLAAWITKALGVSGRDLGRSAPNADGPLSTCANDSPDAADPR